MRTPRIAALIGALAAATVLLLPPAPAAAQATPPAEDAATTAPAPAERVPPRPPLIRELRFEGLLRVDAEGLRRRISSQPGSRLDPQRLSADIKRVFRMRFFADVRVEAQDAEGGIALVFVVKERPAVRTVSIEGYSEVDLEDIEKVVDIPAYEIVNVPKIEHNVSKIREVYSDEGYSLADVTYELVDVGDNLVDLVFRITERAKIKVKRITFLGNSALSDDDLRGAMMGTKEGGYLSFLTRSGMFKRKFFEQDLRILRDFYAQHGYITARIGDPVVTLSRNQEFVYITIHVVEGRRYRVRKVGLQGDFLDNDQEELQEQLELIL